jgi:hypothetical protein
MNTDSQASFAEIKELLSKSLDQGESSAVKNKGPFQGHEHHNFGQPNGSKGSGGFTKLEFPDTWGMTQTCGSTK